MTLVQPGKRHNRFFLLSVLLVAIVLAEAEAAADGSVVQRAAAVAFVVVAAAGCFELPSMIVLIISERNEACLLIIDEINRTQCYRKDC